MSTHRQREILIEAIQMMSLGGNKIGSDARNGCARVLRWIRGCESGRIELRKKTRKLRKAISRNPGRFGMTKRHRRKGRRLYPTTVHVPARAPRIHSNCAYCGTGYSTAVCGECSLGGIDGPVIKGTEARRAYSYIRWSENKSK